MDAPSLHIEPATTEAQLKTIEQLAYEIIPEFYAPTLPHEHCIYFVDTLQTVAALKEQLGKGYSYFLLHLTKKPVGYLGLEQLPNELHLSKLYILKAARGNRLGEKAIAHTFSYAANLCVPRIWLTVNRSNQRGIVFYQRHGFAIESEKTTRYGNGHIETDYVMATHQPVTSRS